MEEGMEDKEAKETKFKRIKRHLGENKKTYLVGGACFVIGVAGGLVFKRGGAVNSKIVNGICWKPRNTIQTISMYGNRIGRPGTPVIDMTTGKRFESMSLAAASVGASPTTMTHHLSGRTNHVNGHEFKRA